MAFCRGAQAASEQRKGFMTCPAQHISICIVGFHNADDIARCLAALSESTYKHFDVVICENGGADSHARLRQAIPAQLPGGQAVEALLADDNLGYAGGVNEVMRARPDSDGWWIVNPDTQPEAGALAALVERINRGDCHAAGGILYHADGKVQAYGGYWRQWLGRAKSIGMGCHVDASVDVDAIEARMNYILGASMLVNRTFRDALGLMREDYFLYCEEVEWGLRAVKSGMKLGFAPGSRVLHGQGGTTGSADPIKLRPRMPIYMDERNKLNVTRDVNPVCLPIAMLSTLLLLTMRFAARGAWRQWGYALQGWWAGVCGERGKPDWLNK